MTTPADPNEVPAPIPSGGHPHPPAAQYPPAPPAAPGQGQYAQPAQYGYPMPHAVRTPTGVLSWALGFLIFAVVPVISSIVSGGAMAIAFAAAAKHGGVARENARAAANWGLTYVTATIVLVIAHIVLLLALSGSRIATGFFPVGIPITLFGALSVLHIVLVIMGTVKASSGKIMRVPFAIPYIRA